MDIKKEPKNDKEIKKRRSKSKINLCAPKLEWIHILARKLDPTIRMAKDAMDELSRLILMVANMLVDRSISMTHKVGKKIITKDTLQSVIRVHIPGELAKHCIVEGSNAVETWLKNIENTAIRPTSREYTGLTFGVTQSARIYKQHNVKCVDSEKVYLAGVQQYLTTFILQGVIRVTKESLKMNTVKVSHIRTHLSTHPELRMLFHSLGFDGLVFFHAHKRRRSKSGSRTRTRQSKA